MSDDPTRWLDDPATDDAMRAALEAGRDEAPSPEQLASLAARLGPLLLPPGGGGQGGGGGGVDPGVAAGGASVGGALSNKSIGALLLAAALAGTGAWVATRDAPRSSAPAAPVTREPATEAPAALPEARLPEGVDVPEGLDAPPAEPAAAIRERAPAAPRQEREPVRETDPAAELALIERAQTALSSSPAAALSLTEEHARRFGDGALAQEREVVAIDALARSSRAGEARARAARFRARWPRSAHRRRVDVIVSALAE